VAAGSNPSAKAAAALGLPENIKFYSPYPFGGMNTEASPPAIDDKESPWRENFIRLGDGRLRTAHDVGTPIYTVASGKTLIYFAFYTIGATYYCAVFLSDGSAYQINVNTLAQVEIGASGFFVSATGYKPFVRQWGSQYILICNRNTDNDYWVWDGAILYTAGTAAPNGINIVSGGQNYSSVPTVTAFGGQGTGLTVTPVIQGGSVVSVTITNPGSGYEVGDVPQLAFSGGGSNTTPILTANLNAGGVGGVNITAGGSSYTSATVAFSGGGGTGAAGTVIINTGVTGVPVTAAGSGYTYAVIGFTGGGGSGATASAVINPIFGSISSITITNAGTGYTSAPTASLTGNGSGATLGTVTIGGGAIAGVSITNPGSGYTTAPSVAFTSGSGSGATAVALLQPTGVSSVTVVNGGTGFTSVPLVSFVGGGGAGATGFVVLTATSIAGVQMTAGGSGYNQAPGVEFISASGSGATATVTMNGDSIGSIQITNGGSYTGPVELFFLVQPGNPGTGAGGYVVFTPTSIADVLVSASGSGYTSAPAVEVGSSANDSAYATVNLMPYGISGSAIESFLTRVWIVNPALSLSSTIWPGGILNISAPESVWDFSATDGGTEANSYDSFLQTTYTGVRQSSGYLYTFGDESVNVISNVSTSGNPVTTTYNNQNTDPQSGLSWRDTLQDFGRSVIIGNTIGVFGLYGGSVTKISGKMDEIFRSALFPPNVNAITPSGAVATLFDIKHYLMLLTTLDVDTLVQRNVMIAWNEKDWCILSQSPKLNFIGTQAVGTTFNAWGTDGSKLYPLFTTPSTNISKRLDTKYYGNDKPFIIKQLLGTWMIATDISAGNVGISGSLVAVVSGVANYNSNPDAAYNTVPNQLYTGFNTQPSFQSPFPYWQTWGAGVESFVPFTNCGLRFTSTSPDFVLANWVIGYVEKAGIF
jgi:hypothetical protein